MQSVGLSLDNWTCNEGQLGTAAIRYILLFDPNWEGTSSLFEGHGVGNAQQQFCL